MSAEHNDRPGVSPEAAGDRRGAPVKAILPFRNVRLPRSLGGWPVLFVLAAAADAALLVATVAVILGAGR